MFGITRPPNRAEARRLVQSIAKSHGHISEEILNRMSDSDRREVEYAMLVKDQMIGSSVIALAKNLYTSNARFVFELLQNAEDNDYIGARARGETPTVSFHVYPNHVVLECNEDGFTTQNLTAICNIGQSSKTGAQGYIGEKGIGFKSVFMAAYRVHIQSGHFSFHFLHRQGDSGLGMITPVWEEHGEYLGDRRTRITLDLVQDGTPDEQTRRSQMIREEFGSIHNTILLFMKKIEKIEVAFYDQEKDEVIEPIRTITHSIDRQGMRVVCQQHTSQLGREEKHHQYYHVTKSIATNLARAEGRTYSGSDEASKAYSKTEVVLAFPLTAVSAPVLENQWVFAFLPVRQAGFKFLIHTDFVTTANRQDIVTTSARNQGLAKGIAKAFIEGVLQLCNHETLQFQWMRYLPEESQYSSGDFWNTVVTNIKKRVKSTPVLCPAVPGPRRLIEDSRRHLPSHLDASGEPLLPDIKPGIYLSRQYQSRDLERLMGLGLSYTYMEEVVKRAKSDLAAPISRIRITEDEDWQSRLARLLHIPFKQPQSERAWTDCCRKVTTLNLIPLRDGTWASAASGTIYHPKVEGTELDIPPGLGLKVVDGRAAANIDRRRLFDAVGVRIAPDIVVREAILDRYRNGRPTLPESVSYLRFLYLTESSVNHRSGGYGPLRIYSHREQLEDAKQEDVFIKDNDDHYGAAQLLQPTSPGSDVGCGTPGLDVLFAHEAYFQNSPRRLADGSWEQWLASNCGLQLHVPLVRWTRVDARLREITPACRYAARHRPEKFLGLLRANWERDGLHLEPKDSAIIREFGEIPVLCKGPGINLRPLNSAFLPVGELVALCDRFMLDGEFFPWLELDTPLSNDAALTQWGNLGSAFGLGYDRELLEFALVVLKFVVEANPLAAELRQPERMLGLYGYLQAKVDESSDRTARRERIRGIFASQPSIFVPGHEAHGAAWVKPRDCLWKAPIAMFSKNTLVRAYANTSSNNGEGLSGLDTFFTRTLGIPDLKWQWKYIVDEIRYHKTGKTNHIPRAKELYKCLSDMGLIGVSASDLKRAFEDEALICGPEDSWYTASNCLWSSTTTMKGKCILDSVYGHDLRDFFVEALGISNLTAEMVYQKLAAPEDGPGMSIEETKEALVAFSSFLGVDSCDFDSAAVLANRVFPVRFPDGEIRLRTGTEGFALIDRKPLAEDFAHLAKFLDFGMDEVRTLQPLIRWAGLEDRYLSKSVEEITTADRESTRHISLPHRDIKRKAHALLRVAVTFNSPWRWNQEGFYSLLRNSETLETETITAELLLAQDNETLRVEKESASLHIRHDIDGLKLYVPRDMRSQEVCFNSKLPRRLCEWIMTDPATRIASPVTPDAVTIVQSVLSAQRFAINDILDEHGIVEVDIADEEDNTENEAVNPEAANQGIANEQDLQDRTVQEVEPWDTGHETVDDEAGEEEGIPDLARPSIPSSVPAEVYNNGFPWPETPAFRYRTPTESSNSESRSLATPLSSVASPAAIPSAYYVTARSSHAASRPQLRPMDAYGAAEEDRYSSLLRGVVDAARRAAFPSRGAFDMSALNAALPSSAEDNDAIAEAYRLRSTSQIERDKAIGAAGELFVFELLSSLQPGLPGFSRANWQSTIRNYVAVHPEYSGLAAWVGRETADITYTDVDGALTGLLIDNGYLASETWADAQPHYFIEVKTTTKSCSTPFFMSKYQYRRMQNNSNHNNDNRGTVYVVFRVFNLGTDDIGVRILVDPESMRRREELSFTAESWSVVAAE